MPSLWTSVIVLLGLTLIFAASWIMFFLLADRSTDQRSWLTLMEWGKDRGFRARSFAPGNLPPPLHAVTQNPISARACLARKSTLLVQLEMLEPVPGPAGTEQRPTSQTWNVLIATIENEWSPTGLRPALANISVLDLFSLTSFPLLGNAERFVVFGTSSRPAASLSRSSARGLLPADVGLLLHGQSLLLDFSNRPFDTIEFERMIVIADQIVNHLPHPETVA